MALTIEDGTALLPGYYNVVNTKNVYGLIYKLYDTIFEVVDRESNTHNLLRQLELEFNKSLPFLGYFKIINVKKISKLTDEISATIPIDIALKRKKSS